MQQRYSFKQKKNSFTNFAHWFCRPLVVCNYVPVVEPNIGEKSLLEALINNMLLCLWRRVIETSFLFPAVRTFAISLWLRSSRVWVRNLHFPERCLQFWSGYARAFDRTPVLWQVEKGKVIAKFSICSPLYFRYVILLANSWHQEPESWRAIFGPMGDSPASWHWCIVKDGWSFFGRTVPCKILVALCRHYISLRSSKHFASLALNGWWCLVRSLF